MIYWIFAMKLFLSPTDPKLNEQVPAMCSCSIRSARTQETIDKILKVALGETGDINKKTLVGLAAPQVGVRQRIIVIDLNATGIFTETTEAQPARLKEFINPEILWKSDELNFWREGCFSTGNIHGIVPRADKVLVRAYDRTGKIFTEELTGYTARIAQHEIDHLDGIRFPDRIENDEHLHLVEEHEIPQYRIHWTSWGKKCSRQEWEKIKNFSR